MCGRSNAAKQRVDFNLKWGFMSEASRETERGGEQVRKARREEGGYVQRSRSCNLSRGFERPDKRA